MGIHEYIFVMEDVFILKYVGALGGYLSLLSLDCMLHVILVLTVGWCRLHFDLN